MNEPRIRILCADDHPVVREGLRALLGGCPDMEVVALAANGDEALTLFRDHQPDVTVMDLKMPGASGLQAIERIRAEWPHARIIVLTTYEGDEDIFQAIQAGAATYILKDALSDNLVNLVRSVHEGARPIPERIAVRLAERIGLSGLTRREMDVLGQVSTGRRNKEIAWELGITEETVQVHIKNIFAKLNVHDRTEAVMVALQRGILHLP